MIELFTHTLDVPTWFAIFVLVLLFWAVASAYTWWVTATSANALIELIAIRAEELRAEDQE